MSARPKRYKPPKKQPLSIQLKYILVIVFLLGIFGAYWVESNFRLLGSVANNAPSASNSDSDVVTCLSINDDCSSPNAEISADSYKILNATLKAYPEIRPAVQSALADGIVTNREYWDLQDAVDRAALTKDKQKEKVQKQKYKKLLRQKG